MTNVNFPTEQSNTQWEIKCHVAVFLIDILICKTAK